MGFDLQPKNEYTCAVMVYPDCNNPSKWGRYNVTGWIALKKYLAEHNVVLANELPGYNDGDLISDSVCRKIAEVLDMATGDDSWLQGHANWWRTCGGCWVW